MARPTSYVRFADGVEEIQPHEDQLGDETVASMARMARLMFEKNRHALRDAHAKSHGILRGELHVAPSLPAHRPLGSINRVHIKAYTSLTQYCHGMNAAAKVEPTNSNQLPD